MAFCGFSWWQHWGVDLYLVGEAIGRFMVNCGLALSLVETLAYWLLVDSAMIAGCWFLVIVNPAGLVFGPDHFLSLSGRLF